MYFIDTGAIDPFVLVDAIYSSILAKEQITSKCVYVIERIMALTSSQIYPALSADCPNMPIDHTSMGIDSLMLMSFLFKFP